MEAGAPLPPCLPTDQGVDEFLAVQVDLELVYETLDEGHRPLGVACHQGGEEEVVVEEVVSPAGTLTVLGQVIGIGEVQAPTQDALYGGDHAFDLLVVRVALHLGLAMVT